MAIGDGGFEEELAALWPARAGSAPPVVVVDGLTGNESLASTDGARFRVSSQAARLPRAAVRYLAAHEAGHVLGRHGWITALGFAVGVGGMGILPRHPLIGGILFLLGGGVIVVGAKTMVFEHDADRRGALLLPGGPEEMIRGMEALREARPETRGLYDGKIAALRGEKAPLMRPKQGD